MSRTGIQVEAQVHTVTMSAPGDVTSIVALFDLGVVEPSHVVAVLAQTEDNNDSSVETSRALRTLFSKQLGTSAESVESIVPMLMVGSTAGLMCPHLTLLVSKPSLEPGVEGVERLAIGAASTRPILPEELGTAVEVCEVAAAVAKAMQAAGITDPAEVKNIQITTPILSTVGIEEAARRGRTVCCPDALIAAGMTRGAAALGAAVALGEINSAFVTDKAINRDKSIYSQKAFASSGGEQGCVRVVVLGNVNGAPGRLRAANGVMAHQLDLASAQRVFQDAGLNMHEGAVQITDRHRVKGVFVKAGAEATHEVCGLRHTMNIGKLGVHSDSQAKAVAHAILAAIVGHSLVLANAGPEHQGRAGSNLLCVIASVEEQVSDTGAF